MSLLEHAFVVLPFPVTCIIYEKACVCLKIDEQVFLAGSE